MNTGLIEILSRRLWVVPEFIVWGLPGLGDVDYLNIENVDGTKSLAFGSVRIGDTSQSVNFVGLVDIRGNNLPSNISRPFVTARSQNESQVFVIGTETSSGFKIARDPNASGPVKVDLVIMELGE